MIFTRFWRSEGKQTAAALLDQGCNSTEPGLWWAGPQQPLEGHYPSVLEFSGGDKNCWKVVWRPAHAGEPSDTSVCCNCLRSPFFFFLLNLLLMILLFFHSWDSGVISSDSTRFVRHFWMCIYCEVILTNILSLPPGRRRLLVLIHWSKLKNVSSENMFFLTGSTRWRLEVLLKTFVIMEKSWWQGVLWQLLGQTYWRKARELSSVLQKKLKIAFIFFCRVRRELKLHITNEAHGMRFDV